MFVSIPIDFYEDAIRKFDTRSDDPVALAALIVLLNDAERSPDALAKAKSTLESEERITKFIKEVREDPPRNYKKLLQRIEDRIRSKLESQKNTPESVNLQSILDTLGNMEKKGDLRGQKIDAVHTLAGDQTSKLQELQTELVAAHTTIGDLNKSLADERKARAEDKKEAENQRRKDKRVSFWNYVLGYGLAITGLVVAVAPPPILKRVQDRFWKPPAATDQNTAGDKGQKKQEIENAVSGKNGEAAKPDEPAPQTGAGSSDKNDKTAKTVDPPAPTNANQQIENPSSQPPQQEIVAPPAGSQNQIQPEQPAALPPKKEVGKKHHKKKDKKHGVHSKFKNGRHAVTTPKEAAIYAFQRSDLIVKQKGKGSFRARFG
jgi:hypothetical protein